MTKLRKKHGGYSIIELILVFSVILLTALWVLIMMPKQKLQSQAVETVQATSILAGAIKTSFQGRSNGFLGLGNAMIINSGAAPTTLVAGSPPELQNAWTGAVTVAPLAFPGGAANTGFVIQHDAVPGMACLHMLRSGWMQFEFIEVDGVVVKTTSTNDFDTANMINVCTSTPTLKSMRFISH